MSKYTDQEYIDHDPYIDECEVKVLRTRVVTTRKEQTCMGAPGVCNYDKSSPDYLKEACPIHQIPTGTRARYESAIVDGSFGSYYTCTECLDKAIAWYRQQVGEQP